MQGCRGGDDYRHVDIDARAGGALMAAAVEVHGWQPSQPPNHSSWPQVPQHHHPPPRTPQSLLSNEDFRQANALQHREKGGGKDNKMMVVKREGVIRRRSVYPPELSRRDRSILEQVTGLPNGGHFDIRMPRHDQQQ